MNSIVALRCQYIILQHKGDLEMEQFQAFIAATPLLALLILCITYAIGDTIGTLTKAWVPSVFVVAILFLFGYWTFFPKDIVTLGGLGAPLGGTLAIMMCITHMGTAISLEELKKQWKIIVICLVGLVGMIASCLIICPIFIDFNYIIAGLPPLTGGIVAATMMQSAAQELGLERAAIIAICMYVCQGFAGYPLTALMLKKEGRNLLKDYRGGAVKKVAGVGAIDEVNGKLVTETKKKKKLIPEIPNKYYSTALSLSTILIVAFASSLISTWTKSFMGVYAINQAVIALVLGIVATELGFLRVNVLKENGCFNFLMFVLMIYVFSGLNNATPSLLLEIIGPMALIIVVGVVGMSICAFIAGKILKVSPFMAIATSLTALYGFPPNYVLTDEASKALAENDEEKAYLMDNMLPQMIVGGFVTVTITSVIIASVFIPMLHA